MVPVKSFMVPAEKFVAIDRDTSVRRAAEIMKENGIGSVFVSRDKEIIGILTDTDLVRRLVAAGWIRTGRPSNKSCRRPF